jgi:hypothetical protein
MTIADFIRESNRIEGIMRDPTPMEIDATAMFLEKREISVPEICALQEVYAPDRPIRDRVGMNVRVGHYTAPLGGRSIVVELMTIVGRLNKAKPGLYDNPWLQHVEFERLHPFMDGNGRTGRTLWAWQMCRIGRDPFALPFLHRFYYQTLENHSER